ncbi:hypothetical protein EVAR_40900_1 [Eumeta japonica]|uniref:Uncharacterized protein n=1 Tax=Eumeta variegata TaxID=151549 RepID=A0A4C1X7V6_EUMVA|nr:hypothetical protein EVAR_40900_1 [Eumeta japonica]
MLYENLAVRKRCTRRVPHNLSEAQKLRRGHRCREMMKGCAGGDLNDEYYLVTGDGRWMYCHDPETKRRSTQCLFRFEELLTEVKPGRSVRKKMVTFLFGMTDLYATIVLEDKKKTADWQTNNCLSFVLKKVQEERPRSGILILTTHRRVTRDTTNYLGMSDIEILAHLPCIPDLVSCDFYLFPKRI